MSTTRATAPSAPASRSPPCTLWRTASRPATGQAAIPPHSTHVPPKPIRAHRPAMSPTPPPVTHAPTTGRTLPTATGASSERSRLRGLGLECSARRLAVHAGLVLKDEAADLVAAHRTLALLVEVAVGSPAVHADLPEAELEFDDVGPLVAEAEHRGPAARRRRARG